MVTQQFLRGINQVWCFSFTIFALVLLFVYRSYRRRNVGRRVLAATDPLKSVAESEPFPIRPSEVVSDADLRKLIVDLENDSTRDDWEPVIEKSNNLVSYYAKCCKTQDGPLKYVSVTTFENCSSDLLRDFYMDNEYRRVWDKTVVEYEQLQINEGTGVEIGRMIKKFPLLSPREYVLAWSLWEGKDESFYCITKDCEHPLAPRKKKYVRVKFYFSGWKIRKVPGRDASEIKIVYQEDAGMNVDIAKVVFAKGIWSYVCKMDSALRKYSSTNLSSLNSSLTILKFMQKVPADLEIKEESLPLLPSTELSCMETKNRKLLEKPSRKTIAKGLVLLGGAIFLTRNHASIGAKFAMFCIVNNSVKNRKTPSAVTPGQTEPRRVSWIRSSLPHWPQK